MMFAGATLGSSALASETPLSNASVDPWNAEPIRAIINGFAIRPHVNSLTVDDTQGEQVTADFVLVNPDVFPAIGDVVSVTYFDQVLFAGTIDRIKHQVNNTLTARIFSCTCTGWSKLLSRHVVLRNFTDITIAGLMASLLSGELLDEGITTGVIDYSDIVMPLVDSRGATAWDVVRDVAGITGQSVYMEFDKSVHFQATSNAGAPLSLDLDSAEGATIEEDRETYRNLQKVLVTGTPPDTTSANSITSYQERQNDDQISERQLVEGGSGIYEAYEEVTHPISNNIDDLNLLAVNYANIRLASCGSPRQILSVRVRGYGFRAGQFASLDLETLGVSGEWLIQRVGLKEEDGRRLIYQLELVRSNVQQRAYESWVRIIQSGKVTIQLLSVLPHDTEAITTTGAFTWTVPALVTRVTITAKGAGAGGGGGIFGGNRGFFFGGRGGNGGKVVQSIDVVPGTDITGTIGVKGEGGTHASYPSGATNGTDATDTTVVYNGITRILAAGGKKGTRATSTSSLAFVGLSGSPGAHGGGSGSVVTVGGGKLGGSPTIREEVESQDGQNAELFIEW